MYNWVLEWEISDFGKSTSTMIEIKSALDGINSRLENAEEKTSKLKDKCL